MSNNISRISLLVVGIALGGVGALSYSTLTKAPSESSDSSQSTKEPLYWVAPMDPNYTRDKPGKSPMGMDLIPVYDNDSSGSNTGPGTIKISPEVVNNLGVRTTKIELGKLHDVIETVGFVAYDEDQLVHIHPRVEGWIEKLYVKAEGDPVTKGQALYDIYSPALVNAQEEFLLALDRKNKRLLNASQERLRALQLPESAIRALKKTRKVKQNITFYAPQGGVIDNLNIREGFFVKPGKTLMSIGNLEQVWVEAEIFERQSFQIDEGLEVTMSLDFLPGKKWQGRVDYVYPTLDNKTRTLKVRLRFDNPNDALKPNMFAQVTIHTPDEEVLRVPREAIIRTGNSDRVVLALGDGHFKSVDVNVGRYDMEFAEILSGVKEGDIVASSAQFLLDSESSKTSDFKRMSTEDETTTPKPEWVEATINNLMPGHRMINVDHLAIDAWGWPSMTMDFTVAENVDFSLLKQGLTLHVEVSKTTEGDYVISNIHMPEQIEATSSTHGDNTASTSGVIKSIMPGHRMLTIDRDAITKWNRPAATAVFTVSESVDMSSLNKEMSIDFTFEAIEGGFVITQLEPVSYLDNTQE